MSHTNFRLQYDSLAPDEKKKYADLFAFFAAPFSFSEISESKKREIYLIQLFSFFDADNQFDSSTYKAPAKFTKLYEQLVSLFGNPTGTQQPSIHDSLFIKQLGLPVSMYWSCNTITLQIRVRYGCSLKELNVMAVEIKDRRFEDMPEPEKIAAL
ncbi:MAG: hypothetical protein ABIQ88_03045 [Chitinophagaceae bacterium]